MSFHGRLSHDGLDHRLHSLEQSVRLPSTAHLRALEAAARLGSFERASHELAITASAVAKRVAGLEALLGVKMLSRTGRGVEPTAIGREYLEQVNVALGLLTRSAYHRRDSSSRRRLRVATPPTFGRDLLVPHLHAFSQLHPDIELELMPSIPYLDITAPGWDVEIRFGDGCFDGVDSERLTDETVFPVASPAYLAQIRFDSPADMIRRAILLRCPLEPWEPWMRASRAETGHGDTVEPTDGHRLMDLGMLMEAALNGHGVALARRSLARRPLQAGKLIKLFAVEAKPTYAYYMCWHRTVEADEARSAFIGWLRDICVEAQRG
jgi:LysR family glycine cleavage system transcriptional activator